MIMQMTEMQKSALKEVGNIGSGHAAIALSQLMGKKIMIAVPSVDVFALKNIQEILPPEDKKLLYVSLSVLGDARGVMIFCLEDEMAKVLCDVVMGQDQGSTKSLGDLEISAIKEVASIVSASYLNVLSEMTGFSLVVSTPDYDTGGTDILNRVLSTKDIDMKRLDEFLCIRTEFIEAAAKIDAFLLFMPYDKSIQKILGSLGV